MRPIVVFRAKRNTIFNIHCNFTRTSRNYFMDYIGESTTHDTPMMKPLQNGFPIWIKRVRVLLRHNPHLQDSLLRLTPHDRLPKTSRNHQDRETLLRSPESHH